MVLYNFQASASILKLRYFPTACIQLRIDCETISGSGKRGGSSDIALASQEHEAGVQAAAVPIALRKRRSEVTGDFPTEQEVLNLAASKYLKTIDPSRPEDLNGFVHYLREIRELLIVDTKLGSLIITVECSSLEILDKLWDDYCTGLLNEMAQTFLVTEDILQEFGLIDVKLTTTMLEEEYMACREHFSQYPS